jgi:hypothetical protein
VTQDEFGRAPAPSLPVRNSAREVAHGNRNIMGGLIVFFVGAVLATLAIAAWALVRWRAARAAGGRRW